MDYEEIAQDRRSIRGYKTDPIPLGLRQCPGIQVGSACIQLPQGVRNIPPVDVLNIDVFSRPREYRGIPL